MLFFPHNFIVAVAQSIIGRERCLRLQVRSFPVFAHHVFSCSISRENSGSVKNRRSIACIYPALIRKIFSRRGPLSSGVIMCMYGNFTFRLVTVYGPHHLSSSGADLFFFFYCLLDLKAVLHFGVFIRVKKIYYSRADDINNNKDND